LAKLRCVRKLQVPVPPTGFAPGGFTTPRSKILGSHFTRSRDQGTIFGSSSQSTTHEGKYFSLDIKVDHPIVLYGIHAPTLCSPVVTLGKPPMKEYDESFTVTVLDDFRTTISQTEFFGKIACGSDINLKKPIILQKNVSYKIQVSTNNTYFLSKKLSTVEDCPPVKFTFKDTVKVGSKSAAAFGFNTGMEQETDCAFITELIYSVLV
jgi:hypothetical protein